MSDLPAPIRAYLDTHIIANRYPAYLLVDKAGGLIEWGGRLEAYGIADLQKGQNVGEQLFFLVGLLPLHGRPLFLPCVETESHGAIDLYIFPGDGGDWVLLLDATAEILRLRSLRQKEHELHLVQERRATEANQPGLQDAALEMELFAALDVLVLERVANGVFRTVGTLPDWCQHVYPEAAAGQDKLRPGEQFLFLENFLIDAEQHWRDNAIGHLKSGPWTELDLSGHERHLEAVAIQLGDRKILLVKLLGVVYEERQQIIQIGREKSLAYERLARATGALRQSEAALQESERRYRHLAEALRKAHDELEQRVAERTAELTKTNSALQSEIVERTRVQERLAEDADIFAALARVAQELIASLNAPTILERLCRLVTEVLECDRSSTVLWQPQDGVYVVAASYGNTPEQWEVIRTLKVPPKAVAEGIARLTKEEVIEIEIASPPQSIPAAILHRFGVTAALFLVLRRGQELIGVQTAAYCGRKGFSSEQKRIAQGISQTASLALANAKLLEELEHANRVKDDFVGTMSHELRTPLNIILGYNDLLLEGEFGNLEPEQMRVVQRVDKSARELVDLVTATLDLSRLQSQQLPLTLQKVQVAGLVEEVVTDIRYLNSKPTLSLQWETAPNLPPLRTDPLKLKVVLKNLITNAVKFTAQGSVSITAQRKGAGIEFCVTDTGIGIAPEALSAIFEPFRQLNNSTTRLHSGVGLGLYIVCQLLDLLEGTISVDSEVGKGSTFRVWLPQVAKRT